ncbi:hypothetical protein ACSYAD_28250 [Acaryochloris marina NIES-2412]|uniref:hypothetical protein n=1 Tax=Acaryochloris marina TaxID=155978 RepID=UPI004058CAC2
MTCSQTLALSSIILDPDIQPRQQLNQEVIAEYSEDMKRGATFPPVIVFYDGSKFWLADGFHRIAAKQANGDLEIIAERKSGSRRDAILYAAGANVMHGLRRTNADKHRVVERLLQDSEWCQWSDNAIAQRCGVSHPYVGKIRRQSCNDYKLTTRKGSNGNLIDISNIGKRKKASRATTEFNKRVKSDKLIAMKSPNQLNN